MKNEIDKKNTLLNKIKDMIHDLRIRRAIYHDKNINHRNVQDTHAYWKQPDDGHNNPKWYTESPAGKKRSEHLVQIINSLEIENPRILEIGTNAGRNLNALYANGYKDLSGIEISSDAVEQMQTTYPDLFNSAQIFNESVEDAVKKIPDDTYDIVFTMAVLQHIHSDSINGILDQIMLKSSKYILIHEVEDHVGWRHFPRNYKKEFKVRGANYHGRFKGLRVFSKNRY
tara:strand:+ start:720 stop:1403 length:684 start_codon:yes stop_codon:yes gene_type:complete